MGIDVRNFAAVLSLAAALASESGAAGISEFTYLRMAAMRCAPVVDGVISIEEQKCSSAQYGPISANNKLMSVRYGSFYIGYTEGGIYFAARTSAPPRPQKFTAKDRVGVSIRPKHGVVKEFSVCVADGSSNLPLGAKSATRRPRGIDICGMECAETEMFIPFSALNVAKPADGTKWGLQMFVEYSSAHEIAYWHMPAMAGEMGSLVFDSKSPVSGLVNFGAHEQWRPRGGYWMQFRFDNPTAADVKLSSKSVVHRGIGFAKLDDNPETAEGVIHNRISELHGEIIPSGTAKEIVHPEYALWPGKINSMEIDISANGATCFRRRIRWDISRGLKWEDSEKLPTLDVGFYPSAGNRFRAQYAVNGNRELVSGAIRVLGVDGKTYWVKEFKGAPVLPAKQTFDEFLPGLPEQDYVVRFEAVGKNSKRYADERTFSVRRFPWQDTKIGTERVIVPPFRPIRIGEKGDIEFLQTSYRPEGVLWGEIHALGENLLAAPVDMEINGGRFEVMAANIVSAEQDRVIREVNAVNGALALKVTQNYDYDGFCWTTMEFTPKSPVRIDSLRVKMPLKNGIVKCFDVCCRNDRRAYVAPDFTLPSADGEVWSSATNSPKWMKSLYPADIQPYVWFGGAAKGLCWMVNSIKGMSLDRNVPAQRIVRENGAATLYSDIVNKCVIWDRPVTICMGFQPTPVKPQNRRLCGLARDMYSGYLCPSNAVRSQENKATGFMMTTTLFPIHTFPADDRSLQEWTFAQKESCHREYERKLKEFTHRHATWFTEKGRMSPEEFRRKQVILRQMTGAKLRKFYLDPMLISCFWPEDEMYKAEWSPYEWPRDNYMSEYGGKITESRIDKLMYDAKIAIGQGYGGIFYDVFGCHRDYNFIISPERAYHKEDGSVQIGGNDLLEQREIVKRTAVLCCLNGANYEGSPYVEVHTTDCYVVPVLRFAAVNHACERGAMGGDWQNRFPEGYALTEICGRQAGTVPGVIVSARMGDKARRERELRSLMALMCAYGFFSLDDQGIVRCDWFEKAWNTVYDFGWGRPDVRIHFYYDETPHPVTHNGKDVRLTVAAKSDSALLLFGNLGEDAHVSFDLSGLGFAAGRVFDAETGETLKSNSFHIERHGYRMIKVERSGL
jgi:hypothetical protein